MQPPDEVMVGSFLPSMRLLVAKKLRANGLSQSNISRALGVTQASVSLYLSSSSDRSMSRLSDFGMTRSEAEQHASDLASAVLRGSAEAVSALNSIWTTLLGEGSVCASHRAISPSLEDCDFCIVAYGTKRGALAQVVSEVSDAVKLLEASPTFGAIIPEVSVNIACAAAGASTPAEVVAVPGRIAKVRDRARAMSPPEAGASMHMSRILLAVRDTTPQVRACINLRYDRIVARILRKMRLKLLTFSSDIKSDSEDPTAASLVAALRRRPGHYDALVDLGGSGIEPNVYLLSTGAREAAEVALEVARSYSAS